MEEVGNEGFHRLMHLYTEAIKARCFIYNKDTGAWYTPEAFRKKYDTDTLSHWLINDLLSCVVIRDPVAGIKASKDQILTKIDNFKSDIERDLTKQVEFTKVVLQYFQDKKK